MLSAKRREQLLNISLALGILLALCLAAEVGLRWVLLGKYNPFERDARLGVRLKTGYEGAYPRVVVRTDSRGRRVPADQTVDATGRYLFIGDSVTFGFSVPARESFPILIAAQLGDASDATVAAVPGYNLEQALALARQNLQWARPEFVVYGLVVNDLGSALSPATYEGLDPHAARAAEGGFLANSAFVAFVQRRFRRLSSRFSTPEAEQRTDNVVRDFAADLPADVEAAFRQQWGDLEALQREIDVPVFVVIAPYALQVHDDPTQRAMQHYVAGLCAGSNLVCLDPLDQFVANADTPLFTPGSSYHFSTAGHALLAEWLIPRLVRPTNRP
jgi:hypothetical protein